MSVTITFSNDHDKQFPHDLNVNHHQEKQKSTKSIFRFPSQKKNSRRKRAKGVCNVSKGLGVAGSQTDVRVRRRVPLNAALSSPPVP